MKSGNKLGLYSCHGQGNNQVHNLLPGSYDVIFSDSRKSAKAQCFFFSYKKQAKARSSTVSALVKLLNLFELFLKNPPIIKLKPFRFSRDIGSYQLKASVGITSADLTLNLIH
jgi:hypothetical protein